MVQIFTLRFPSVLHIRSTAKRKTLILYIVVNFYRVTKKNPKKPHLRYHNILCHKCVGLVLLNKKEEEYRIKHTE
jgi:hypothetical protein